MVKRKTYIRFLAVIIVVGGAGIAASVYTLINQRLDLGLSDTYEITAEFEAANGVASGIGQPVNVVGVKVGQVTDVELGDGAAEVTMQIESDELPRVHANAQAVLKPITPLGDMQVNLDPGTEDAEPLSDGGLIELDATSSPVPLSDLLSSLDGDTRAYLRILTNSLGEGVGDRGRDMQRALAALGPTARDVRRISVALDDRRRELARLVHNLAKVTHAASRDRRLSDVVAAGHATLNAIAGEEAELREGLELLPGTLKQARSTVANLGPFASELGPTLNAIAPALEDLPATLEQFEDFSTAATPAMRNQIRPFLIEAKPLIRMLRPTVRNLRKSTPDLARSFQALEYLVNELAYNPGELHDQGYLFWLSWLVHNLNSVASTADAHGGIGSLILFARCAGFDDIPGTQQFLRAAGICPQSTGP